MVIRQKKKEKKSSNILWKRSTYCAITSTILADVIGVEDLPFLIVSALYTQLHWVRSTHLSPLRMKPPGPTLRAVGSTALGRFQSVSIDWATTGTMFIVAVVRVIELRYRTEVFCPPLINFDSFFLTCYSIGAEGVAPSPHGAVV